MVRFLTVNLVAPWRRLFNGHDAYRRIPILMYHAITDDPEPGVRGYYRLNTPPKLFRQHLQILKDEACTVIDLPTAARLLAELPAARLPLRAGERAGARCSDHDSSRDLPTCAHRNLNSELNSSSSTDSAFRTPHSAIAPSSVLGFGSRRYAVITFDDGFRDFATHAAPALAGFGFTATNFIITGSVGNKFKERDCMSWPELRELQAVGFSFGSHTVTHPKLWELGQVDLERELTESRHSLENGLGKSVDTFAHPYAFPRTNDGYLCRFRDTLAGTGYHLGVTTSLGCAALGDDLLTLKRLPANGADDPALFRAKLRGAYDWLAAPQTLFKRLKQLRARASSSVPG